MSTLLITATNICSGGNHVTLQLKLDGVEQFVKTFNLDELIDALNAVDEQAFMLAVVRAYKIGRTVTQTKNAFLAGVTINL